MARNTTEPTPAIVRNMTDADTECEVLGTPTDRVTRTRGFGASGYRVETVAHDCPKCDFDRMIRRVDVNAEYQDTVRYWCLNPNCVHFVRDYLSHACHGSYPQRQASEPTVYEES